MMKKCAPPRKIKIGNRFIGQGEKCFIIGEIGSNHNLDKKIVRKLIDACAQAKFDAVKFQIYDPEEAFSKNVTTKDVKLDHMYGMRPWWEVARDRILMPREWFKEMFAYARSQGLMVFSTIHHVEDVGFLSDLKVDLFKIASIDANHLPLLKVVAKANKPMLISTGMTTIEEIDETVETLVKMGNTQLCLLHCVSCYPPDPRIINLRNMTMFAERYGFPVGYSDHSITNEFSIAAVAMGACVIEKHITLGRKMEGPDHPFALEPQDMKALVSSVRDVETALGKKDRTLSKAELAARKMIKRSIVAKRGISKGEPLRKDMVKFSRPGEGISPNLFGQIEGRRAKKDIPAEAILSWGMIDKG